MTTADDTRQEATFRNKFGTQKCKVNRFFTEEKFGVVWEMVEVETMGRKKWTKQMPAGAIK